MYDELIKRLRSEAVYLPEKFSKNAELLDVLMKAADAIEELQEDNAALNGTVSNLIQHIEELSKREADMAHNMAALSLKVLRAEEKRPSWISVTERLPDQNSGNLYICLIVGGEYDQLSWYELCDFAEGQFWIQDQLCEGHVTHWMPLPSAEGLNET